MTVLATVSGSLLSLATEETLGKAIVGVDHESGDLQVIAVQIDAVAELK